MIYLQQNVSCVHGASRHSLFLVYTQGKLNYISVFPFLDLVAGLFTFFLHVFHIIQVRKLPMGRIALVWSVLCVFNDAA